MAKPKKPNFTQLVQELINAAVAEGENEARGTTPMQPLYNATHAARDALMDAIGGRNAGVRTPDGSQQ